MIHNHCEFISVSEDTLITFTAYSYLDRLKQQSQHV